jgi:ribonuclease-3
MKNLKKIEKKLQVEFEDKTLLMTAFTHRSYLNEHPSAHEHNERLEYLGDAVLEFLVSKFLYLNYSDRDEGDLTSFRAAIVRTEALAETAGELNYGKYLRMSRGEESTGGREKDYLLANTFESVIGAIYLDQGIEAVDQFLQRTHFYKIADIVENRSDIDPKTKFQEIAQEKFKITPEYKLISETGPDHHKTFIMAVYLDTRKFGTGQGPSKQKAEEAAAQQALDSLEDQVKNDIENVEDEAKSEDGKNAED